MSADPKEGLQCDNSSSSSSGSESPQHETARKETFFPSKLSELNINDEQTTSSDLDVRKDEFLQPEQSPGSRDQTSNQVKITGGEFFGAHFGPQTTYQHFNLEKHEHSNQFHVHYHAAGSSTSSDQAFGATGYTPDQHQAVTEEPSTSSEEIELCRFIKLFPQRRISENICNGEQISEVTGMRPLAIKLIHYKVDKLQEAKILTKLHPHHNVVSIVHTDIYKQGAFKYIYIAMELCHKQNLQDYVNENKNNNVPFDPQLSISQAKQLIEGLKHIHSNDIIHRDLKPHNVLFTLDKKTLKIADFGISKEMTSGRTVTFVTNARAGTDGYRAPETYNSNVISKQTDIFSLGLVFYFLWSNGHHSFGEDPDEWNINIKRNRDRDFSHLLLPDKEKAIDLLEWMLRFNPRERPTVCQILRHQMFGGTEKGPEPINSGSKTTPTGPGTRPKEAVVNNEGFISSSFRKVSSLFMPWEETLVRSEQGTAPTNSRTAPTGSGTTPKAVFSTQEMKPSTSKTELNLEEMKLLKEKSQRHMENEEYSLASEALQNLLEYQPDLWTRIETIQQLAECHVMCNVPIHEDIEKLLSMYKYLRRFAEDIEQVADDHFKHSRLIRAYFMYICASKWYKTQSSPSDAVKAIECCIEKILEIIEKKKQVGPSSILLNCAQSGVNEMLEDLASCYLDLGQSRNNLGEYEKARDYLLQGLNLMENHFKDVVKHKLYGHISKNLADSEYKMGNKREAWVMRRQAIDVFKKAEDYEEEDERSKDIARTRHDLPLFSRFQL